MYEEVKGYIYDGSLIPITKDLLTRPKEDYQVPHVEFLELENFMLNDVPPHSHYSPPRSPFTVAEIEILYHNMVLLASLFCDAVFPEVPTRDSCIELTKALDKYGMLE